MEEINIPLKKSKTYILFICSIIFVIIGIVLVIYNPIQEFTFNHIYDNKKFRYGILAILFFSITSILIFKKLSKSFSLIIYEDRIIDNTTGFKPNVIYFKDILEFSKLEIKGKMFIMVKVENPQEYIKKEKNILDKLIMKLNFKFYGSPFMINKTIVKYNFNDLFSLLNNRIIK